MAHLLAPRHPDPELPVFFNVDGVVGAPPAQNLSEDVLLVQFALKVIGDSPKPGTPPGLTAAARAVRVTGNIDTATVDAIRALQAAAKQRRPATVVDGRVSPARSDYGYAGDVWWTIAELNDSLQDRHIGVWPRIDRIPGCPAGLQQMVIRTVVGRR